MKSKKLIQNNLNTSKTNSIHETLLELVLKQLPGMIFWKDNKSNYLGANQNFLKFLGLKNANELIGKQDTELPWNKNLADYFRKYDSEILTTGMPKLEQEEYILNNDEHLIGIVTSKFPLRDEKENIIGIIGIAFDIAEYNSANQIYLENIIGRIPYYIFWKNRDLTYLGCNQRFADLVGKASPKDIVGKTDFDLGWGDGEAELYRARDKETMSGNPLVNEEEILVRSDGNQIVMLVSKVPLRDKHGNCIGVLGISTDITERKKIEQELLESKQRAENANKAKSEFFAAINHELRTPLTGMLGMARLLASESLAPEHADQVNDIVKAGEHLLELVNDLLDIAKLEAGKLELNPTPIDLRKLTEEIATMLTPQAKAKKLEMRVNYQTGTPHLIVADAKAIRQILLNLVGNSLKFTHEGHIEIKIECMKQTAVEAELKISVSDTGIGIPPDKLETVFERFNQVDNSRTRKYGGTGLGLTINKAYVELMGGELNVESELGKGSTFSCVLNFPLQIENKIASTWEPYKSKVRILIVDDNLLGEVIKKHIGSPLCDIVPGFETLSHLLAAQQRKQPYHVVIIDQQLRTANSMELAKKINQQSSLEKPMLLLLMKPCPMTERDAAKAGGFFECMIKPVHPTELLTNLTASWEKWQARLKPQQAITPLETTAQFKVLLVEDDPIIQKVHGVMLKKIGCTLDIANNGIEALEMYNNGYDVIFMDIGLGEMSGMEVATEIRRRENGSAHIPIIAMTGYGDEDSKNSCIASGMDDVIVKPTTPEILKEVLAYWVVKADV